MTPSIPNKIREVPYDIALSLKQLGFDQLCQSYYEYTTPELPIPTNCKNSEPWLRDLDCAAPEKLQAMEWFQTEWGIFLSIQSDLHTSGYYTLQIIGPFISNMAKQTGRPIIWAGDNILYQYENTIPSILRKAIELMTVGIFIDPLKVPSK